MTYKVRFEDELGGDAVPAEILSAETKTIKKIKQASNSDLFVEKNIYDTYTIIIYYVLVTYILYSETISVTLSLVSKEAKIIITLRSKSDLWLNN